MDGLHLAHHHLEPAIDGVDSSGDDVCGGGRAGAACHVVGQPGSLRLEGTAADRVVASAVQGEAVAHPVSAVVQVLEQDWMAVGVE